MIGLIVCFSAIFLKLPTVLAVLEDMSAVKNISFRVLFAEVQKTLRIGIAEYLSNQLLLILPCPILSFWGAHVALTNECPAHAHLHDLSRRQA
jgi:hypothetical protein